MSQPITCAVLSVLQPIYSGYTSHGYIPYLFSYPDPSFFGGPSHVVRLQGRSGSTCVLRPNASF